MTLSEETNGKKKKKSLQEQDRQKDMMEPQAVSRHMKRLEKEEDKAQKRIFCLQLICIQVLIPIPSRTTISPGLFSATLLHTGK